MVCGTEAAPAASVTAEPMLEPATVNPTVFPCSGKVSRLLVRVALMLTDEPAGPEHSAIDRRVASPRGRPIRQMPRP